MNANEIRWLGVCFIPLGLWLGLQAAPAKDATDYLINGIILACANVFLFKWVLFAYIGARLKQDNATQRQALWQFVPLMLFAVAIVWYFQAA